MNATPFLRPAPLEESAHRRWAIAEGFIAADEPSDVVTDEQTSKNETLFLLNAGAEPAHVTVTVFFSGATVGPFRHTIEPKGNLQLSLAELPEMPRGTYFTTLVEADAPIVVLATRRRSLRVEDGSEAAPLTQIAFAG